MVVSNLSHSVLSTLSIKLCNAKTLVLPSAGSYLPFQPLLKLSSVWYLSQMDRKGETDLVLKNIRRASLLFDRDDVLTGFV